jgi:hypothetical protein
MSPDEMRLQKAQLMIQVEDAEKHLNALLVKSAGIGDKLAEYAEWLRRAPHTHIYRHGTSIHYGQDIDTLRPLSDSYVAALDIKSMLELADEIRKELLNVRTLKERLARL